MDREAWQAIVHEVTESDTTKQLSLSYSYSNQNTGTGERIAQRNRIKNPEIDPHIYSQLIFHLTKERQYNGKKKTFQKIVLKPLDIHMQKQKWLRDFTPLTKTASKWITDQTLNCCCSAAQSYLTLCNPMNHSRQASLSITNCQSLPKPMSFKSVMPSDHLILCRPLLLLPPIPPSIRVFQMSQLFASGGQSIGASASTSVLPMNTQD